jgi:hypothetical protein
MNARPFASFAILLAIGCNDATRRADRPSSAPQGAGRESAMNMQPSQPVNWVEGPAIEPTGPLLAWLDQNARSAAGKRQLFRLPITVRFQDQYRLGIGAAFIGTADQPGAVQLKLDDTGMGVSLLSTLRNLCPKDQDRCVLWLAGYWGKLLDVPDPLAPPGGKKVFAVLRVGEIVDAAQGAPLRASVEAAP